MIPMFTPVQGYGYPPPNDYQQRRKNKRKKRLSIDPADLKLTFPYPPNYTALVNNVGHGNGLNQDITGNNVLKSAFAKLCLIPAFIAAFAVALLDFPIAALLLADQFQADRDFAIVLSDTGIYYNSSEDGYRGVFFENFTCDLYRVTRVNGEALNDCGLNYVENEPDPNSNSSTPVLFTVGNVDYFDCVAIRASVPLAPLEDFLCSLADDGGPAADAFYLNTNDDFAFRFFGFLSVAVIIFWLMSFIFSRSPLKVCEKNGPDNSDWMICCLGGPVYAALDYIMENGIILSYLFPEGVNSLKCIDCENDNKAEIKKLKLPQHWVPSCWSTLKLSIAFSSFVVVWIQVNPITHTLYAANPGGSIFVPNSISPTGVYDTILIVTDLHSQTLLLFLMRIQVSILAAAFAIMLTAAFIHARTQELTIKQFLLIKF